MLENLIGPMGYLTMLIYLVSVIWVIADVYTHQKKMSDTHKGMWTLAALLGLPTAVVYYVVVKRK